MLFHLRGVRCLELLRIMAKSDPSPFVRGRAAIGLGGQGPLIAIPLLLEMLDADLDGSVARLQVTRQQLWTR